MVGFLCIINGIDFFDKLFVYFEVYLVVKCICEKNNFDVNSLIGNFDILNKLVVNDYIDEKFGLLIVIDIIKEFDKLGCDLCFEFKIVEFKVGVEIINDLKLGMILEGVVLNVVNFGVFVDVGVY